jgi:hypothetical protein
LRSCSAELTTLRLNYLFDFGRRSECGWKKRRSGGRRINAGRPSNSARNADARRALALAAAEYTMEALNVMVKLMRTARQEGVRLMAADRILDRAVGKAPLHIDISALRHDKIVYQSAVEIRRELERRGVPPILIEQMRDVTPGEPSDSTQS